MPSQPIAPAHRIDLPSDRIAVTPFTDARPLYKFLRGTFADALVSRGCLRIGTLFSFRSLERHGPARGDPREGSTDALAIVDDATINPNSVLPPFFAQMISPPPTGSVRYKNAIFALEGTDEDCYIYSLAALPDIRLFQAFGCDTCVRISRPRSFFAELSKALSDRLRLSEDPIASMKQVVYGDRHGKYNPAFDVPGAYVKPNHYAYQREVRMLWTPAATPIEPLIVTVPSLSAHCEVFASSELP